MEYFGVQADPTEQRCKPIAAVFGGFIASKPAWWLEGRFATHFDKNGNPSETLLNAKQERLVNWRTLQEFEGII